MTTIPFPSRCLTLLPPWPQAIAYAGKRIENRSGGVASQLRDYRGLIGLSHSKATNHDEIREQTSDLIDAGLWTLGQNGVTYRSIGEQAARLWLIAELIDIRPPSRASEDPWHVPGQWGLVLGSVWEVEPIPCMGGQGAWRPQWCVACKKIIADSHGLTCKTCKSSLLSGPDMPTLKVVREYL